MSKPWFRPRRFGYGATPNTWQGWLLTLGGIALIWGVMIFAMQLADPLTRVAVMIGGTAVVLIPLVAISAAKTEGGWRWRSSGK